MFKKSLLALAVLGSSSAFGATTVGDATEKTFANELFGESNIVLNVNHVTTVSDNVSNGATATFTYTLSSGTFGQNPTLTFGAGAGTGGAGIALASGGAGSNTVSFTVVVTNVFDGDETFTLATQTVGAPTALGDADGVVSVGLAVDNTNIVATGFNETVTVAAGNNTIADADPGVTFTAAANGGGTGIDLNDQTQFDGGAEVLDLYTAINLAEAGVLSEDGVANLALGANDEVVYTVTGNFAADSSVCLVPTGETDCDNEVGTSAISGNTATITIPGDDAVAAPGTNDIIYIVDGDATIPMSEFSISAAVDWSDSKYQDSTTYSSNATYTLGLAGLNAQANRVNIITKPGAADETYIRVTNTTDAESIVYITLTTQDGETTVTGQLDSIAANATAVYTSSDIATAVGVETWSGRGNASILTSAAAADVVVVPLVRTNGVLVNQSAALTN